MSDEEESEEGSREESQEEEEEGSQENEEEEEEGDEDDEEEEEGDEEEDEEEEGDGEGGEDEEEEGEGDDEEESNKRVSQKSSPKVQFDLNRAQKPTLSSICNLVDNISYNVESMIDNFPCLSGKGFGSFTRPSYSGARTTTNNLSLFGTPYGQSSGLNFRSGNSFNNADFLRNSNRPFQYRAPDNVQQLQNASNMMLESQKKDDLGGHQQNDVSKDLVIKEAYREAYQQAYQDMMKESQKQKEQYRNELLEKVEEKRKMLEMIKSSASQGEVQQQQQQQQHQHQSSHPPVLQSHSDYRVETEKLKGGYEQERIAQLEKIIEKKKKREKYRLREESQQIIDNYYKNLFKPNTKERDDNLYYKNTLFQEPERDHGLEKYDKERKIESKFLRQKN